MIKVSTSVQPQLAQLLRQNLHQRLHCCHLPSQASAHGLRSRLEALPDFARRMEWWETGARYQLVHALAIGLVALLLARADHTATRVAGGAFAVGVVVYLASCRALRVRELGALLALRNRLKNRP